MKQSKKKKTIKKTNKTAGRRKRRFLKPAFLLALSLVCGFMGYMSVQAHIVHLRSVEVYLPDLPAGLDGSTILYISDFNLKNASEARDASRIMEKLETMGPDMLILGGDYSANTLFETINEAESSADAPLEGYVADFIASLAGFDAPMGKFAVLGEEDRDTAALQTAFRNANISLLQDACGFAEKNGERIIIAGLNDTSAQTTPYTQLGSYFTGDECVIAVAHNPAAYIGIRVNEAKGGGAWADLVLSGHTLGGQMKIFDRTLRALSDDELRCLSGWHYADDLPLLVSQGLACKDADLRLNTQSEIHLITLRRQTLAVLPDL